DGTADAAGLDGASPADSSPTDPCVGAEHWICDDFDRDSGIGGFPFWDPPVITDGSTLAMMPPGAPAPPSSPNALVASAPSNGAAYVSKGAASAASGMTCQLDFRIDESAIDYQSILVVVNIQSTGTSYYRFVVTAGPPGGGVDGFGDYGMTDAGGFASPLERHDFARGSWNHLAIEVTNTESLPKISLNGAPVAYTSSFDLTMFPAPVYLSVQIGAADYVGSGAWSVAYDNAYCDLIP
ncbi:MAG: hypothetical protein ACREJX_18745, partial [Polyangiaceae bacterium]